MTGFQQCVQEAWEKQTPSNRNPLTVLHIKLSRIAKALRAWSKKLIPQGRLTMAICREVIAQLETTQEVRALVAQERQLVQTLKLRLLGLAAIEKSRVR